MLDLDELARVERNCAAAQPSIESDPVWGNSDVLAQQWEQQFAGEDVASLTLGVRLRRIAMLQDEIAMRACDEVGLKLNEFLLLMALRRMGAPYCLKPSQILRMHSVTSGTATYRIDQLTKQGLAERINDPHDKRGYLIRMTPLGLRVVDGLLNKLRIEATERLRPFTAVPGAMEALVQGLRFFEQSLSTATDTAAVSASKVETVAEADEKLYRPKERTARKGRQTKT
jgi:DNA-binding MarR family transcriptional regulator